MLGHQLGGGAWELRHLVGKLVVLLYLEVGLCVIGIVTTAFLDEWLPRDGCLPGGLGGVDGVLIGPVVE